MKNILKLCILILLFAFVLFFKSDFIFAQSDASGQSGSQGGKTLIEEQNQFFRAQVAKIIEQGTTNVSGESVPYQLVKVKILDKGYSGPDIVLENGGSYAISNDQKVKVGDLLVLVKTAGPDGKDQYFITDRYRLNTLAAIGILFLVLIIAVSRWKGVGSMLGLGISFLVIVFFIVPQIIAGHDPLLISIIGAFFIMISTIYLAHGFSKQTTVSVVSTTIVLVMTALLSYVFVFFSQLSGIGSEDVYSLKFGATAALNFKGLLLGGIIIGALGVLDDVTTSQSAIIFELFKANSKLSFGDLVKRGLSVGKEHIASLVNTLVLAYAGVALPVFIFFVLNPNNQPIWVSLNSEFIAEEIVRTLSGSMGLVLAIPLTTFLASWAAIQYLPSKDRKK